MMDWTNSEIDAAINEWIHSERDRGIMHRRLVDGIYFEPLAEEFGLSVRQVKSIVYKHSTTIFSKLKQ